MATGTQQQRDTLLGDQGGGRKGDGDDNSDDYDAPPTKTSTTATATRMSSGSSTMTVNGPVSMPSASTASTESTSTMTVKNLMHHIVQIYVSDFWHAASVSSWGSERSAVARLLVTSPFFQPFWSLSSTSLPSLVVQPIPISTPIRHSLSFRDGRAYLLRDAIGIPLHQPPLHSLVISCVMAADPSTPWPCSYSDYQVCTEKNNAGSTKYSCANVS